MRFPIDVVALDRDYCVRGVWEGLGPFRIAAVGLKTHKVLELPVGAIRESQTQVNDQLALRRPADPVDSKSGTHAPALLTVLRGIASKTRPQGHLKENHHELNVHSRIRRISWPDWQPAS